MKDVIIYVFLMVVGAFIANSFMTFPMENYIEKVSTIKLPEKEFSSYEQDLNVVLSLAYEKDTIHAYYINRFAGLAVEEKNKFGFPASVKLAQFLLEGGFSEDLPYGSRLASQAHNPFGIKYYGKNIPKRIPNWEAFIDEGFILAKDDCKNLCQFVKFKGFWHAFRYHSYFTVGTEEFPSHYTDYVTVGDWSDWVSALKKGNYASSSTYVRDLTSIINKYQLYLLDNH